MKVFPYPIARRLPAVGTGTTLAVVLLGVLITGIDATIVVLALPEMGRELDAPLNSLVWVITGYLLVTTLLTTQAGRLGDMLGRVRVYQVGFLVLTVASVLCALAWDATSIVSARVLQGIGAGLITANSGAIIAEVFPREKRGKAYGYVGVGWSVGAVLGILVGGLLVTYASWRWIFWINLPIGAVVLILAMRLRRAPRPGQAHRLDVLGMATLGLGLLGVLWAVTTSATRPVGPVVMIVGAVGVALVGAFVVVERAAVEPMLPPSLFRTPAMTTSLLVTMFQGLGNYAVLWLALMYLHGPVGLTPLNAALLLAPGYIVAGLLSPLTGRIADRLGPSSPAMLGLIMEIVGLLAYTQVSASTGLWLVVTANLVNGIGLGLFVPANNAVVMKAARRENLGVSAGVLRTFASIGWVFSIPVAIVFASQTIPREVAVRLFVGSSDRLQAADAAAFTSGLRSAFVVLTGVMVVALILSILRLRTERHSAEPAAPLSSGQPVAEPPDGQLSVGADGPQHQQRQRHLVEEPDGYDTARQGPTTG